MTASDEKDDILLLPSAVYAGGDHPIPVYESCIPSTEQFYKTYMEAVKGNFDQR